MNVILETERNAPLLQKPERSALTDIDVLVDPFREPGHNRALRQYGGVPPPFRLLF